MPQAPRRRARRGPVAGNRDALPGVTPHRAGVGRTGEIEAIRGRIEQEPGPPGVLLVAGDAGMGKTSLVAHAVRDTHALVLYGRCDEDVTLAYRPLVEALTQFATHLPAEVVADHLALYGTGLPRLVPELGPSPPAELRPAGTPRPSGICFSVPFRRC